ncbi:MAG: hypothetical protein A2X79_04405 [Desulfuromonadaceae bacterium GWB2_53_15]|nr:MAG: hypothetical protein A2X83_04715 [Desulfuromonadales bacterium GWD2_54_10]OHB32892.1 MAG: hypothetical protein A2X79_04405 [Desulfuromonadaceae bacterium GWB2_53_15]
MHNLRLYTLIAMLFLLCSGCAMKPAPTNERYFWPPLPDRPRIEWLRSYSSQLDMDKTDLQRFKAAILGDDAPISLLKPIEVKSDVTHNKFYVSDIGAASVFVFDVKQREVRFLHPGADSPPIVYPLGLALDQDDNLYLLERRFNNIFVFDQNERMLKTFNIDKIAKKPVGLAINKKKKQLFVTDGAANKVHVLDLNGNLLFSFGGSGETNGSFNLPVAVAINSKGEILVADTFNARVQAFDENGVFRRSFGKRGDGTGDFQLIKSLAVDSDDNIYVIDGRSHKIIIFNTVGELLLVLGDYYAVSSTGKRAPGGFAVPVSIDIDSNDVIHVVDQLNSRVQVFQYLSDAYLNKHPLEHH